MNPIRILIAILSFAAVTIVSSASFSTASQQIPKESKEQPTKVKLATDSGDDKWGQLTFDHTNHTTPNYSIDGKSPITCVECHHTDQPKDKLTPPLVTSKRTVSLTADVLKDAAAPPVKSCRVCHVQAGVDSEELAVIKKDGKDLKVDNEAAYHTNCFACHDEAIKARPPDVAAKIPGSDKKGCIKCHAVK